MSLAGALRAAILTARDWSRLGAAVEEIDRVLIAELTGTGGYLGGFVDHRGGVLSLLGYARGTPGPRSTRSAHSRAVAGPDAAREGDAWAVSAPNGSVRRRPGDHRDQWLLGPGGAQGPWPRLARTVIPVYSYIAATRPLSDDYVRRSCPRGRRSPIHAGSSAISGSTQPGAW